MWFPRWLFTFIAVTVTVVWAAVWCASLVAGRPEPDQSFNLVMGALVGAAGGFGVIGRKDRRDG